jgi:hypothetical protein
MPFTGSLNEIGSDNFAADEDPSHDASRVQKMAMAMAVAGAVMRMVGS